MGRPRVAVLLRHGLARERWGARHAAGAVASASPYAYHHAEPDVELLWSADHAEGPIAHGWRALVARALGFDLVHVWRNRALLREADAVWTHTEREHLAVAFLKALAPRRYRARSVAQSVWLWDAWPRFGAIRRRLLTRLLTRHDVEVVLSRVNLEASRAGAPDRSVVRLPFGTHFAVGGRAGAPLPTPARVLAIGNDRHRDWTLLAEVARLLPDMIFHIVSLSERARSTPWPPNATLRSWSQADLLAGAYRDATVVAVPLLENRHASGCTVVIEAISAGVPVVATDVGGLDEYVSGAVASLVPAGDARAFADAVRTHTAARRGDGTIAAERGLSEEDYIARLVTITQDVLAGRALDPRAQLFQRMPRTRALSSAPSPASVVAEEAR